MHAPWTNTGLNMYDSVLIGVAPRGSYIPEFADVCSGVPLFGCSKQCFFWKLWVLGCDVNSNSVEIRDGQYEFCYHLNFPGSPNRIAFSLLSCLNLHKLPANGRRLKAIEQFPIIYISIHYLAPLLSTRAYCLLALEAKKTHNIVKPYFYTLRLWYSYQGADNWGDMTCQNMRWCSLLGW